jgi:hypothetical protein
MFVALLSAIVGGVVGAFLTKWLTADPTPQITAIDNSLSELRKRVDTVEADRREREKDDQVWAERFTSAASTVAKIGPSLTIRAPEGDFVTALWAFVFPDVGVRGRILQYLVEADGRGNTFSVRLMSDELLRRQEIRRVVDETLKCINAFRDKYPELYAKYLRD